MVKALKNSKLNSKKDENQVRAGETGGIETVVKAINIHINNVDVCKKGCGALMNMTINNGKNTTQTFGKQTVNS